MKPDTNPAPTSGASQAGQPPAFPLAAGWPGLFFAISYTGFIFCFSEFPLFLFFIVFEYTHRDDLRLVFSKKFGKDSILDTVIHCLLYRCIQISFSCVFPHFCYILRIFS